jgi:predicted metal-binding membrane protein
VTTTGASLRAEAAATSTMSVAAGCSRTGLDNWCVGCCWQAAFSPRVYVAGISTLGSVPLRR